MYYFKDKLKQGDIGVKTIKNYFEDNLLIEVIDHTEKENFKGVDVSIIIDKYFYKIEIKTDFTYYKNVFIETLSDCSNDEKIGGPFRARKEKAEFYLYYFYNQNIAYMFETDELCDISLELSKTLKLDLKKVQNKTYFTVGYAIPLNILLPLTNFVELKPIISK